MDQVISYVINVALGFVPGAITLIVLYFLANAVLKRVPQTKNTNFKKTWTRPILFGSLAVSLVFTAMQPSITYKHVTFDQQQESQHIQQLNDREASNADTLVIKDNTKPIKGLSNDEFDNMVEYNNDGRD